eukprot:355042-Chlamydomonas_euryale.AAC.2
MCPRRFGAESVPASCPAPDASQLWSLPAAPPHMRPNYGPASRTLTRPDVCSMIHTGWPHSVAPFLICKPVKSTPAACHTTSIHTDTHIWSRAAAHQRQQLQERAHVGPQDVHTGAVEAVL